MTFWLYNPPEPTGQPTSPGPFDPSLLGINLNSGFSSTDLFTRGRCGNCKACPPMWRMVVPILPGNPYSADYAGVVYFRRVPYEYAGVFTGYFQSKCSWGSTLNEPIHDANPYQGPLNDGWAVTFEYNLEQDRYTWSLYSPTEIATVGGEYGGTRWVHYGQFFCLAENVFQRFDNGGSPHPFPYVPELLTLTPFYG